MVAFTEIPRSLSKTDAEVIQMLGDPDEKLVQNGAESWLYNTEHPGRKTYYQTGVEFDRNGKARISSLPVILFRISRSIRPRSISSPSRHFCASNGISSYVRQGFRVMNVEQLAVHATTNKRNATVPIDRLFMPSPLCFFITSSLPPPQRRSFATKMSNCASFTSGPPPKSMAEEAKMPVIKTSPLLSTARL